MAPPTSRESDKFIVRLPDGMRDRIKAAAEANNRSMNAEIVATLEKEYPAPVDPLFQSLADAISKAIVSSLTIDQKGQEASDAARAAIDDWFKENPEAAKLAAHVPYNRDD